MNENTTNLGQQFICMTRLLHRYHHRNLREYGPMGNPLRGQGRILMLLKMRPEISQKDLSFLLDMRPQSLGEVLSKLEKNGYITRSQSETDKRVMDIKLTEEGAKAAASQIDDQGFNLFNCLSENEQNTLSGYLDRIISAMKEELGDEQNGSDFDMFEDRFRHFHQQPEDRFDPHHHHSRSHGHHDSHDHPFKDDPRFSFEKERKGRHHRRRPPEDFE